MKTPTQNQTAAARAPHVKASTATATGTKDVHVHDSRARPTCTAGQRPDLPAEDRAQGEISPAAPAEAAQIAEAVTSMLQVAGHSPRQHDTVCDAIECVQTEVEHMNADGGVLVRAFSRQGEIYELSVVVVRASGNGNGRQTVATTLEQAVKTAVARALADLGSEQASVRVIGGPPGASVTIDGDVVGTLPIDVRLSPGDHTLAVSKFGYRDFLETIEIAGDRVIEVDLVALNTASPVADPNKRRRFHIAGIGLMIAGGAGLATTLAVGLARTGCQDARPDGCADDEEINPGPFAAWLSLAAVTGLAGLVLYLVAPEPQDPAGGSVRLELRPTELTLRVTY